TPLYEYTLMPMRMRRLFTQSELKDAELHPGISFTRSVPVLKIPGSAGFYSSYAHGNLLFDLESDPHQERPIYDPEREALFIRKLSAAMTHADAPQVEWRLLYIPLVIVHVVAHYVVRLHG